jgi:hypothetical protein
MSESPYRAPQVDVCQAVLDPGSDREKLRKVAGRQRAMLFAILANIATTVLVVGFSMQAPAVAMLISLTQIAVTIYVVVAIFRLAMAVYGIGLAIVLAVFAIIPFVSLLLLLMVNQKATSYLQTHGIKVGFMGVNPNSI